MLEQPLVFAGSSSIQFFYSTGFPNKVSQTTFGTLTLTVQHLCNLQDAMPSIGYQVLPNRLLPREAEDIPWVGKLPKHVPLPKYLAYFPLKGITWQILFMSQGLQQNIN